MRKLILLFCLSIPAFGAISATMQWDSRTTGSSANSGGYDPGVVSPGTDESQQDSGTAISITLATGTTGTGSPAFTSTTHGPGNTVNVTGGSGCTTGIFEILSQAAGVATFDHSMGTAADVCTGTLGGSWDGQICAVSCGSGNLQYVVGGNTIWFKVGTYTWTVGAQTSAANVTVVYEGYYSSHGDITPACLAAASCTRPLITSVTSGISTFEPAANLTTFLFLEVSYLGSSADPVIDGYTAAGPIIVKFCKIDGSAGVQGIRTHNGPGGGTAGTSYLFVEGTEFNMNATGYGVEDLSGNGNSIDLFWNYFHGAAAGVYDGNNGAIQKWNLIGNVFSGNTRGVYQQANGGFYLRLIGNSFYGQTSENVKIGTTGMLWAHIINNIFWGGTYGLYLGGLSNTVGYGISQANAYGNQSTSPYNGWFASPSWTPDITLTASPFTNPGSGDFSLNNTAGGGALLKAAGFPGITPAGTGYLDIGALQSQAAAGASIAAGAYVQ